MWYDDQNSISLHAKPWLINGLKIIHFILLGTLHAANNSILTNDVRHKIKIHGDVFTFLSTLFVGPVNYLGSWTMRHAPCSRRTSVSMKRWNITWRRQRTCRNWQLHWRRKMPPWHWTRYVWTIGQQTAVSLLGTGSPWMETIHLQKVIFNNFSYETLVRPVQNIFQVVFPSFCLLVLTLCIFLVVLLLTPTSWLLPASQWSVVLVSFHWCMGSNLVDSPAQVSGTDSIKQINIGHINLTADDSKWGE